MSSFSFVSQSQFSSAPQSCPTLCDPEDSSTPVLPIHHQLPELSQAHVHQVGDATQPSHPLPSPSPLPSIFPSVRVFSSESVLHIRWPKYWSFNFSISPSNEYSGLISFRKDWLDLLAVQGTLKSLLQHHSWKASILLCSAVFMVQLSHSYVTTLGISYFLWFLQWSTGCLVACHSASVCLWVSFFLLVFLSFFLFCPRCVAWRILIP